MNVGEILGFGTKVMVLGLAAVFIALAGIVLTVTIINKAVNINMSGKNNEKTDIKHSDDIEIKTNDTINVEEKADDDELIAVITAAVASSLNRSTHNVIVRKVTRVTGTGSEWNKAGRYEYISSKL